MTLRYGVFVGGTPITQDGEPLDELGESLDEPFRDPMTTPWGRTSDRPSLWKCGHHEFVFLARHGPQRDIAPHQINYRANVWSMKSLAVDGVIATHTVGSIDPSLKVGQLIMPNNLIDYTWGRASTFDDRRRHVDFSQPYDERLQQHIVELEPKITVGGIYGVTQGPRLETAAEIQRMARDGCTLVGMTGMPEAGLARELDIPYVSVCVVVNPAAGVSSEAIDVAALSAASHAAAGDLKAMLERL